MAGPDIRTLLRNVAIFAYLDDAALGGLARFVEPREFGAGAVIVGQDDPGEALYVLASGKVKVVLYGESGREIILSLFRTPGDFFGEMSLLDDQPRSATVIALERSTLLSLSRADFRTHLKAHPRTALEVLAELSRRLRRADEVIGNLALLDVYGRVARWLREQAESDGEETDEGVVIRQRPTQQEIAGLIGTSRETVSRALSELARRGHIAVSGKRILLRRSFVLVDGDRG
jgi:CRP/FNR family transcriptional regulator, cyclic AMP receptor protein